MAPLADLAQDAVAAAHQGSGSPLRPAKRSSAPSRAQNAMVSGYVAWHVGQVFMGVTARFRRPNYIIPARWRRIGTRVECFRSARWRSRRLRRDHQRAADSNPVAMARYSPEHWLDAAAQGLDNCPTTRGAIFTQFEGGSYGRKTMRPGNRLVGLMFGPGAPDSRAGRRPANHAPGDSRTAGCGFVHEIRGYLGCPPHFGGGRERL
jgi:hypothetical protein